MHKTHRDADLLAKESVEKYLLILREYNNILREIMNERELMKLAEKMEEFSISDYTVEELEKMSGKNENYKDKYFDFYDDVKDRTRKKQDW